MGVNYRAIILYQSHLIVINQYTILSVKLIAAKVAYFVTFRHAIALKCN